MPIRAAPLAHGLRCTFTDTQAIPCYTSVAQGGSFGGQNWTTTWTIWNGTLANGTVLPPGTRVPLHFRGRLNLAAVVDAAVTNHRLLEATDVVVGGDSAGGLAAYWSADWWKGRLSPRTRFGVAPDSGYFLNTSAPGGEVWRENLAWIVDYMNSTESLDSSCLAAHTGDPTACAFPNNVLPHIETPVFVMQVRPCGIVSSYLCLTLRTFTCVHFK